MNVQTYLPGETIEVFIPFESYGRAAPLSVTVEFGHDDDPEAVIKLTCAPRRIDGSRYYQARLTHKVEPSDKPGQYVIKALHADYGQGDPVGFEDVPDAAFRTEKADIPPPKADPRWDWNKN